jgi:hypothetical protein
MNHTIPRLAALLFASVSISPRTRAQAPASTTAQSLVIGETFTLRSAHLNEVRRINVYTPPVYADSRTVRLPVLYMPDGGVAEDFLHIAGLVQVSTGNGTMRPFVLIGIENTERRRDLTGPTDVARDKRIAPHVGGSAQFRDFIRDELMPEIKRRYRTTNESAIVGESLAGLFVVETYLLEPSLFDSYIAVDPSLWWNNGRLVSEAKERVRTPSAGRKTLYYTTSRDGDIKLAEQLANTLRASAPPNVTWHYEPMPEETHATIYHPAALRAFRAVFKP